MKKKYRGIVKLQTNRVWRTYLGGKTLDEMYGNDYQKDDYYPENWIASVIEARNPDYKSGEGLSKLVGTDETLLSMIESDPERVLGKAHVDQWGVTTGVLVKFLDAAERLTIQVHPDKEKAMDLFQSQFGKTEAWYILGGRSINNERPHIYYGFKEGITRAYWQELFETQNIQGMLDAMHKLYVKEGQVYMIKGGLPHAIGEGCFILEIQEPTDYTIRVEKVTPEGYEIPDKLLHQGLGFDRMFDCFHYTGRNHKEILEVGLIESISTDNKDLLITYDDTTCFAMERINVTDKVTVKDLKGFSVLVITKGSGSIQLGDENINLNKGDQLFVSNEIKVFTLKADKGEMVVLRCLPPMS